MRESEREKKGKKERREEREGPINKTGNLMKFQNTWSKDKTLEVFGEGK
jgi:hypothetical protein